MFAREQGPSRLAATDDPTEEMHFPRGPRSPENIGKPTFTCTLVLTHAARFGRLLFRYAGHDLLQRVQLGPTPASGQLLAFMGWLGSHGQLLGSLGATFSILRATELVGYSSLRES